MQPGKAKLEAKQANGNKLNLLAVDHWVVIAQFLSLDLSAYAALRATDKERRRILSKHAVQIHCLHVFFLACFPGRWAELKEPDKTGDVYPLLKKAFEETYFSFSMFHTSQEKLRQRLIQFAKTGQKPRRFKEDESKLTHEDFWNSDFGYWIRRNGHFHVLGECYPKVRKFYENKEDPEVLDVRVRDELGFPILFWAAFFRCTEDIKKIIAAGANVNDVFMVPRLTPRYRVIHIAASAANPETLELLVSSGASITAYLEPEDKDLDALTVAASDDNLDNVKYLMSKLKNSMGVFDRDHRYAKAINVAVSNGHLRVAKFFAEQGVFCSCGISLNNAAIKHIEVAKFAIISHRRAQELDKLCDSAGHLTFFKEILLPNIKREIAEWYKKVAKDHPCYPIADYFLHWHENRNWLLFWDGPDNSRYIYAFWIVNQINLQEQSRCVQDLLNSKLLSSRSEKSLESALRTTLERLILSPVAVPDVVAEAESEEKHVFGAPVA